MKASIAVIGTVLGLQGLARAQAAPAGTASGPTFNPGPTLPAIDGSLQYSLSASEAIQTGYYGRSGVSTSTILSGNVEYISPSQVHPFSLLYGGGVMFGTYSGSGNGVFQNLSVSQGLVGHGWALGVSDSVSLLPQSPTTGLSGIPGAGDLGLQPAPDPNVPAQTVLTIYGKRLSNSLNGNIERQLTSRMSISGSGNYAILRFIGDQGVGSTTNNNGLDSTQIGGNVGLNRKLTPLSNASINAYYSNFSYTGNLTSFNTRGINVVYNRQLSRTLSMSVSAGPQFVNSFQAYNVENTVISRQVPSSVNVAASASLGYSKGFTSANISYNRGVNAGSGVQTGALADTISAGVARSIKAQWAVSSSIAYTRTSGLALTGVTSTIYGGAQVSRRLTHSLSMFVGYTAINQSTPTSLAGGNAYNGFSQSGSIGITYAPRAKRLGQM